MNQELVSLRSELTRGGALCKKFNRFRDDENLHWQIELNYALEIISKNEKLQACTPDSIGRSLLDIGVMGLTLSPSQKLAYLISYGNDCTASPSYMGLEQISYRTGFVEAIQTNLVREGDLFEVWTDDDGTHIRHEVKHKANAGVTHAYCIAWFSSGRRHVEVMDKNDLLACREAAAKKNKDQIPWTWKGKFRGEMYKKCVLRRGWKHWPRVTDPKIHRIMDAVERSDPMEFKASENDRVVPMEQFVSKDDIQKLVGVMENAGVPSKAHDSWLQGLAQNMGYKGISKVPAEEFGLAMQAMEEGIKRWKGSLNPESSTQPKAANSS